ncbi:hypothetical protein SDC9_134469 [bioreactor metagenome]|uniref:Uncharacterized protein n=1 Tax=bioreactor metagenome TaxID=1076179 RepID=A0A645DEV4_9ZZZZ
MLPIDSAITLTSSTTLPSSIAFIMLSYFSLYITLLLSMAFADFAFMSIALSCISFAEIFASSALTLSWSEADAISSVEALTSCVFALNSSAPAVISSTDWFMPFIFSETSIIIFSNLLLSVSTISVVLFTSIIKFLKLPIILLNAAAICPTSSLLLMFRWEVKSPSFFESSVILSDISPNLPIFLYSTTKVNIIQTDKVARVIIIIAS